MYTMPERNVHILAPALSAHNDASLFKAKPIEQLVALMLSGKESQHTMLEPKQVIAGSF